MNKFWIKSNLLEKGIFLKGNVPSSKNSKQIQKFKKYKRLPGTDIKVIGNDGKYILQEFSRIGNSKTVEKYLKEYQIEYIINKVDIQNMFRYEFPWIMGLYFVRDSNRKFDYNNASQILQDTMVKYNIIDDDNADYIQPVYLGYHVDKNNPGVYIINCNRMYHIDELISYFEGKLKQIPGDLYQDIDRYHFVINQLKNVKF